MIYKVIQAISTDELNKKVNELINLGYTPIGSHKCVVHSSNQANGLTRYENDYSQTMIKDVEGEGLAEKVAIAISALETIYEDAEMAVNGSWNKSNEGFLDQMTLIDNTLSQIK